MNIDELWDGPLGGNRSWYDRTTPEIRRVVDELVEQIISRGTEPNWAAVRRYMEERFPGQTPTSKAGVSDNLRRLVKERS